MKLEPRSIVGASAAPGDAANSFIIRTPGSYYLIGNITAEPGKHGISIQANDVTLDLNGFALLGGGSAFCGVNLPVPQSGFCIRDGSVRGWSGGGVQAGATVTLAEKLRLTDNVGAIGLLVGNGSMVKDCVATANAIGFRLPDRTHISDCIATLNTGDGFASTSYVSITDCTSSRNGGNGIVVAGTCSVIRCTATRNLPGGDGIMAEAGCTVADCTAGSNGNDGISVGPGSTVRGCTSRANGNNGIAANAGHCHGTGNTSDANARSGIEIRNPIGGNRVAAIAAT